MIKQTTRVIPRTRRVERQHAEESIAHLKRAGFHTLQILAAGDGQDCPVCAAMHGKLFKVEAPPRLPPLGCRCKPYGCRLVVVGWTWRIERAARRLSKQGTARPVSPLRAPD